MPRPTTLLALTVLATSAAALPKDLAAQGREGQEPSFLMILVDDLGWTDVGFGGSTFYETPNIDRLATQGMVFTNGYAPAPLCSATRASIMSGQYPGRVHITGAFTYGGKPPAPAFRSRTPTTTPRPGGPAK